MRIFSLFPLVPLSFWGAGAATQTIGDAPSEIDGVTDDEIAFEAEDPSAKAESFETSISQQWFLAYSQGNTAGGELRKFHVNRGYINIKTRLGAYISTRITPDLTVDRDGDGAGDLELRLKYVYAKLHIPTFWIFTKPTIEGGVVHRPWLDFEEHINRYRAQGTMFLERNHLFNSADNGLTLMCLLGGEMDETFQQQVSHAYPGRYGSFAVGVYNGGGYHALENNLNKVVEGRLTIRPLPDIIPGFQLSYFGAYGRGNTEPSTPWWANVGFVSWEHRYLVVTGAIYDGQGNSNGSAVNENGRARHQRGYSAFVEGRIPAIHVSAFGRHDYFDPRRKVTRDAIRRWVGGLAYHFLGDFKAIVDYDRAVSQADGVLESIVKATIEVNF